MAMRSTCGVGDVVLGIGDNNLKAVIMIVKGQCSDKSRKEQWEAAYHLAAAFLCIRGDHLRRMQTLGGGYMVEIPWP